MFLIEFHTKNKKKKTRLPIGGGLWIPVLHPELSPGAPVHFVDLSGCNERGYLKSSRRRLAIKRTLVSIDVDVPPNANGVALRARRRFSGGLALYVKDGVLSYEWLIFFEIMRTHIKAKDKLPNRQAEDRSPDNLH